MTAVIDEIGGLCLCCRKEKQPEQYAKPTKDARGNIFFDICPKHLAQKYPEYGLPSGIKQRLLLKLGLADWR